MPDRGHVVVTGASTGIGRATALHLGRIGFTVLAGVRREEDGAALREEARGVSAIETVIVDITDPADVAALGVRFAGRGLAGLVNNAGVSVVGPLEFLPVDDLRRQFEVNLFAHLAVTQALLEPLRASRGRIVNMSSIGGRFAAPYLGPYNSSKFALEGLSDSLRRELRSFGIRVSLVEPGSIDTEIWRKGEAEADAAIAALSPRGRELYGRQLAGVRRTAQRTARHAIPAQKVADAVEHALTASRPRARYVVGTDARVQLALQALLPTHLLDRVIARITGT